jgi:hypothetical protein
VVAPPRRRKPSKGAEAYALRRAAAAGSGSTSGPPASAGATSDPGASSDAGATGDPGGSTGGQDDLEVA